MPSELVNQFEAFKLGEFQDSFELANKALEATLVGPVWRETLVGKFKGTPKGVPLNKRDLKWFDKLLVGVDAGFLAPKKITTFFPAAPLHMAFFAGGAIFLGHP